MNPKISDFGMARIFGRHELEANTNQIVGTFGYMSPEYAMEGNFSEKSDVYSFGVLLLEIVSGRNNNTLYEGEEHHMNLVAYAWKLWKEERSMELMDSSLADSSIGPQITRAVHVALLCVQDDPVDRPSMSDVVFMLANENVPPPTPTQAALPSRAHHERMDLSSSSGRRNGLLQGR